MGGQFCPRCMTAIRDGAATCPVCGGDVNAQNIPSFLPVGFELADTASQKRYVLGLVKGNGGFGVTYIGQQTGTGRLVAVKEYYPMLCQPSRTPDGSLVPPASERSAYEHGMESFLQEAQTLKKVANIPSVVKVIGSFRANGTAYMVMDYLKGATLRYQVAKNGPMDFEWLMERILPLAESLARVHDAKLLHRDIAPDNIMLTPEDQCVLMDFGCARSMEDGRSMSVVLKEGFAPIEQYTGHGQKEYTDVYALSATVYYCITGQLPPAASARLNAKDDHLPDPLKPPSALGAKIAPAEEQALLWGLGLQPMERPQNARQWVKRMREAMPHLGPTPPGPNPRPTPARIFFVKLLRFVKDNKLLVAVLAAVALGLLLLLFN